MRGSRSLALAGAALLALTACGTDEPDTEPPPETAETVAQTDEAGDPFEDIPDDAPIHDMDEDDITRHMLGCDEDVSAEECEAQYQAGVEADFIDDEVERCQQFIEADGIAPGGGCSSFYMTNAEFYALYEERTGGVVPVEYQEADPTCEELHDDLAEAVSDYNRDPGSITAEWAVETAEDQLALYDCQEEVAQDTPDPVDPSGGDLPSIDEVDLYGPISHPDELYVDIDTLDDCDSASIIWGGLLNAEMEGFDIDHDYVAEIEAWMDNNAACP